MKQYLSLLLVLVMALAFVGCEDKQDTPAAADTTDVTEEAAPEATPAEEAATPAQGDVAPGYVRADGPSNFVDIRMDSGNHIVIELDAGAAPVTVDNFKKLVGEGFYNGLTFHRIIAGFMIQGGDPTGNGTGGSDEEITGEFAENGHDNPISHVRGVISMARAMDPNSASSQFFIVHKDSTFLDGQYAAFGKVDYGMEEVDRLAMLETDANDFPIQTPVMDEVFFVNPQ